MWTLLPYLHDQKMVTIPIGNTNTQLLKKSTNFVTQYFPHFSAFAP